MLESCRYVGEPYGYNKELVQFISYSECYLLLFALFNPNSIISIF